MPRRVAVICLGLVALVGGYWILVSTVHTTASPSAVAIPQADPALLDQPRAGLSEKEIAAFNEGKKLFSSTLDGFGPFYNATSCAQCHFNPTLGGSAAVAGNANVAAVSPDPVTGDAVPYFKYALPGWTLPPPPPKISHRIPPPLYGLFLIEQIPDETIRAHCGEQGHFDRAKMLGSTPHNAVSRFGAKPFVGTVPDFVDSALLGELGITTPIDRAKDDDQHADPEVGVEVVSTLAAFVRGLAPPGRNGSDAEGEEAFHAFGCAGCHVPDMEPARGVFSDFCVHRMGDALADGISDKEARGDEFRTTPLWGLRFRKVYLHDGRASSLDGAIAAHAGSAESAARAYQSAPEDRRAALLRFLATL